MRAAVGKPKRTFEKKTLPAEVAAKREGSRGQGHPRPPRSSRTRRRATTATRRRRPSSSRPLTAKLGAEGFAKIEKLVKEEFEERKYHVVRDYVLSRAQAHRRARHEDDSPHRVRGRHPPARPRLGALPARRDAGRGRRRRSAPRATSRRSTRSPASGGSASCSTTTSRRTPPARPSRCAARAGARSATAPSPSARSLRMIPDEEQVPVHHPRRQRDPRVERQLVDGERLRRHPQR